MFLRLEEEKKEERKKNAALFCYAGCIVHCVLAWERVIVVLSEFLQSDSWKKQICVCPMAVLGEKKKINLNRFK